MKAEGLDQLLAQLRALFEQQYQRGEQDALSLVRQTINGAAGRQPSRAIHGAGKQRAPRGSARALIERVLTAQKAGATVPNIVAAASSPAERRVSLSAIRFELYRGKKQRRYHNIKGKWSLPAGKAVPRTKPVSNTE